MIINGKNIIINRKNAIVSDVDEAYIGLVKKIMEEGIQTHNRTGIDTISIAGWNYKFDLSKGFPISETKKVVARKFSSEIQWIHQVQSNRVDWLHERDNDTWDEWVVDEDGIYRKYEQGENAIDDPEREVPLKELVVNPITGIVEKIPKLDKYGKEIMVKAIGVDRSGKPRTISEAIWYGKEYAGTIGEAYGFINNLYKRPQAVEYTLKNNPTDRRMNIVLWQDAHIAKAVLPSCVWSSEYKVTPDGKLHSYVHQRSADVPLGLPFNISQYALLLTMFAKANGYEVGTMSWSIMDAHIYVNQLEGMKKQIKRYEYMKRYSKIIKESSNTELEVLYDKINELYDINNRRVEEVLKEKKLNPSKKIKEIKKINEQLGNDYEESYEMKKCFEHMLTRETPELELASHDSIFHYSTDYVKKDDPYLKENPIGNKELVLKHYHSTPFINMPIAQ